MCASIVLQTYSGSFNFLVLFYALASHLHPTIGSGINFSHLSLLANGIAQRMTINHGHVGLGGHAKVHHGSHDEFKEGN